MKYFVICFQAERTPLDQVHKMLTMLPKRGPDAFESFIEVINADYPWLSSLLENSYKHLMELARSNSFNAPSLASGKCESISHVTHGSP